MGDRPRRVRPEFDVLVAEFLEIEVGAAGVAGRVRVDDGLAPVEFGEDGVEGRIAEPFVAVAREEADAVGLEVVEPVGDLLETAGGVGQRDRREHAELRMLLAQLGAIIVQFARKAATLSHVAQEDAGRADRQDRLADAARLHFVQVFGDRPVDRRRRHHARGHHLLDVERRRDVRVNVDPLRRRARGLSVAAAGRGGERAERRRAAKQAASAEAAARATRRRGGRLRRKARRSCKSNHLILPETSLFFDGASARRCGSTDPAGRRWCRRACRP